MSATTLEAVHAAFVAFRATGALPVAEATEIAPTVPQTRSYDEIVEAAVNCSKLTVRVRLSNDGFSPDDFPRSTGYPESPAQMMRWNRAGLMRSWYAAHRPPSVKASDPTNSLWTRGQLLADWRSRTRSWIKKYGREQVYGTESIILP